MSKPVWRVTPSSLLPRPMTMLRSARSLTSSTRRHVMLCDVEAERVALVEVVVDHRGEQVVRGRDGVEVAGQVEVQQLHRDDLAVPAASGPALDPERRSHRRLADRHRGPLADVPERLAQAHGRRGLALAERGGRDGGDDDVAGPGSVGELLDRLEPDLRDRVPVRLEEVRTDAHLVGDVRQRLERGGLGDLEIRRERHDLSSRRCRPKSITRWGSMRAERPAAHHRQWSPTRSAATEGDVGGPSARSGTVMP